MNLTPLSKSTYRTFTACPWKAHAHKNLGFTFRSGPAAGLGIEVHLLIAQVLQGRLTRDEAQQRASSIEAAELIARALGNDPIGSDRDQLVEQYVAIDEHGNLTSTNPDDIPETTVAHGRVDRIVPNFNNELLVMEWKTGHVYTDDPFERHLYAGLLARALFPGAPKIRFIREYIRTGKRADWVYTFNQAGTTVSIQGPKGRPKTMHDDDGPFVSYLRAIARRIETTAPQATPGKHCTNWCGDPCQFLGAECPLASPVRAMIDDKVESTWQSSSSDVLGSIAENPEFKIIPDQASWAWNGVMQLEQFVSRVKKRLKEWARDNGPIQVGDNRYGWAPGIENVVDAEYALQFMLDANLPMESMCKAVNISKTSIAKLPREFHHVKEALMTLAVTTRQGKPKFDLLKS